jgi:starvation-inducible DNA-binding protein
MASRPNTQHEKHHKINIGLTDEQRLGSIDVLNTVLADLHVLYIKTHKYHWNIIGPDFYFLHKMLDEQYEILAEQIDFIAERVRMIGGRAIGTMAEFLQRARLEEQPDVYPSARDMLHDLLHDHEEMVRTLREDIETVEKDFEDATTMDVLTQQAEVHEKMAWMLGSTVADDHSMDVQAGVANSPQRETTSRQKSTRQDGEGAKPGNGKGRSVTKRSTR